MNLFYHQENLSIEGLRVLHLSNENSLDEYIGLNVFYNVVLSKTTSKISPLINAP